MSDESFENEILAEFLEEAREYVEVLDNFSLNLIPALADPDQVDLLYRTVHTIKGMAGFLAFSNLESLTHAGETTLGRIRDGESPDGATETALRSLIDSLRDAVEHIAIHGDDAAFDVTVAVKLVSGSAASGGAAPSVAADPEHISSASLPVHSSTLPEPLGVEHAEPATADPQRIETTPRGSGSDSTIRVSIDQLDRLMNLVGELVLTRNQIVEHVDRLTDLPTEFIASAQQLNQITAQLQDGVIAARMQPVGSVWARLPRIVRDLAVQCDKQVRLEMEGKDTELDRTVIEAIGDPLVHLVRNSVDHGIESPSERIALQKPAQGSIWLSARHESGRVRIELRDDGKGIDPALMRAQAVERGVATHEQVSNLSDRDAIELIFLPGFSTADSVSNISGRGVGMDVVRTEIERIGGTIDVSSVIGVGTVFSVVLPLTLAIVPALMVRCGEQRYAVPQVNLLELVRHEGDSAHTAIEHAHNALVYRLRDRLLPVISLRQLLGIETEHDSDEVNLVVLGAGEREFCLLVDEISDTAEIVVKPLGGLLDNVRAYAGATIMGDGEVTLILDVGGIADATGLTAGREAGLHEDDEAESAAPTEAVLVFSVGTRRVAAPLASISRLEEVTIDQIERAGGSPAIQYRGSILPLIDLAATLGEETTSPPKFPVLVHEGHRRVGLIATSILDIIDEHLVVHPAPGADGILGSAVVGGKVTDVLDIDGITTMAGIR